MTRNPFSKTDSEKGEDLLEYLKGFTNRPPKPVKEDEVKKGLAALKHLQNKIKKSWYGQTVIAHGSNEGIWAAISNPWTSAQG